MIIGFFVRLKGVEPPSPFGGQGLSLLRLPVSPQALGGDAGIRTRTFSLED